MLVKLKFVNRSQGADNPEVLIFQKNVATDLNESAVAWKIIKNCGPNSYHPFIYSTDLEVGISDECGNYSPRYRAKSGSLFTVTASPSGRNFSYSGPGINGRDIAIKNAMPRGAINANIYVDNRLMATKTNVAPGQKALFQFKPAIWIGVMSQLVEGEVLDSAIINDVNTEISLIGIASATIVMAGGGPGPGSTPYTFTLEDIKKA